MRAGVGFDGSRWSAVVVDARGDVVARQTGPFDAEAGVADALAWVAARPGAESVTAEVGSLLRLERRSRVRVIRISPRAALDDIHRLAVPPELADTVAGTVHLTGGHDMRGRELMPFDAAALARVLEDAAGGGDLVASVTAVGSIANPDHERRAADLILAAFPEARVSLSHDFYSNAFRDRDFTAAANAGLLLCGEALAARLEATARELLPGVPVFFGLNDGGRAPIRVLGATPVHALDAAAGLRMQGARHVAGVDHGDVVVIADDDVSVGHVHGGVPAVHTVVKRGREPSLASNTARVDRYSPTFLDEALRPAAVVDARSPGAPLPALAPPAGFAAPADLVALGAAVTPLSSWADFLAHASSAAELRSALHATEEDLRSQAVHWGAAPTATRVVESNGYALAYGSRNVVRVRVRVVGDEIRGGA